MKTAGSLGELLTEAQQDTCRFLIVTGKLNSADIKVLRRMAGAEGRGRLRILNLMNAEIVTGKEPYLTIYNAEGTVTPKVSGTDIYVSNGSTTVNRIENANYVLSQEKLDSQTITRNLSVWKKIKRQRLNAKGHRIMRNEDGQYIFTAFTRKGLFCGDMFFRCPNLQMVILPRKGKISDRVAIDSDPICYKIVTKAKNNKE